MSAGGVLIVDDHAVFAEALCGSLQGVLGPEPVRWAASKAEALELVEADPPTAAIVDLRLPDVDGPELIEALRAAVPDCDVLVLSMVTDARSVLGCFEAGAGGFLSKEEPLDRVIAAYHEVRAGLRPISAAAFKSILPRLLRAETALTPTEEALLERLAASQSNEEIAAELGVSYYTVRNHVSNILRKLGAANRMEAVKIGRAEGLISQP